MRLTLAHERILIILVALHSYLVGAMLFAVPEWALRFGGWSGIEPVFFGRQAGVFHFALATAYLLEFFRYRGISVMLVAKCIAVVFLLGFWLLTPQPWAVLVSGVGDGLMALVVLLVHRRVAPAGAAGAQTGISPPSSSKVSIT